jgi:hypothetical protein
MFLVVVVVVVVGFDQVVCAWAMVAVTAVLSCLIASSPPPRPSFCLPPHAPCPLAPPNPHSPLRRLLSDLSWKQASTAHPAITASRRLCAPILAFFPRRSEGCPQLGSVFFFESPRPAPASPLAPGAARHHEHRARAPRSLGQASERPLALLDRELAARICWGGRRARAPSAAAADAGRGHVSAQPCCCGYPTTIRHPPAPDHHHPLDDHDRSPGRRRRRPPPPPPPAAAASSARPPLKRRLPPPPPPLSRGSPSPARPPAPRAAPARRGSARGKAQPWRTRTSWPR